MNNLFSRFPQRTNLCLLSCCFSRVKEGETEKGPNNVKKIRVKIHTRWFCCALQCRCRRRTRRSSGSSSSTPRRPFPPDRCRVVRCSRCCCCSVRPSRLGRVDRTRPNQRHPSPCRHPRRRVRRHDRLSIHSCCCPKDKK